MRMRLGALFRRAGAGLAEDARPARKGPADGTKLARWVPRGPRRTREVVVACLVHIDALLPRCLVKVHALDEPLR